MTITRFKEKLKVDFGEAKPDMDNGIVNNLCLFYRESKNGRFYANEAIDQLVDLIADNNNSFLNHQVFSRQVESFLGTFSNVRRVGNKVYASIKIAQHQREIFFSLVDAKANDIGFSIDASGEILHGDGPDGLDLVVSLEKLWSTDLVAFPATTKNMFEGNILEAWMNGELKTGDTDVDTLREKIADIDNELAEEKEYSLKLESKNKLLELENDFLRHGVYIEDVSEDEILMLLKAPESERNALMNLILNTYSEEPSFGLSREERENGLGIGKGNKNPYLDDKYAVARLKESRKDLF